MDRPHPLLYIVGGVIAVFLFTPSVIVAVMSFSSANGLQFPPPGFGLRWYETILNNPRWTSAALTSLVVGCGSAALATSLGTLTAIGLVRGRLPMMNAINAFIISPLIVPSVVTAIGIYFVFVVYRLSGTHLGMILGHTALSLPFVVLIVRNSLRRVDRDLELAAQSLGAGPTEAFVRITLPLIVPGVVAGAIIAFVTSWDDLIVALFLKSSQVLTIPTLIWSEASSRNDPSIAAASTAVTLLTLALAVGAYRLVARR